MTRRFTALLALALFLVTPALAQHKRRSTTSTVTIPEGTRITVRVIDDLDSSKTEAGQEFQGTLYEPIVVSGREVYPKGADVMGRVKSVHKSGRLSDPGVLVLDLLYVQYGGRRTNLNVEPFTIKGESHTKSNVTKIGGGAAAGAIIGAIAGGGKGAAIGAGVGAAAGTGVAAATGKKEAKVEPEAVLQWNTIAPATTQASAREPVNGNAYDRNAREQRYEDDEDARSYDEDDDSGDYDRYVFSARDRRTIRSCFLDNQGSLPPGLAKRDRLPPGLERQLQRNGTLPPGLQKRVQPLPGVCESRLPRLPNILRRVAYAGRIMLLNRSNRIIDTFFLGDED